MTVPGKGGRPTKFTPQTREKLLTALRAGNYRNVSCQYAGIHYYTLIQWLNKAKDPDAPPEYVEFAEAVEKAEADAEIADIALIRRAAQDQTDEDGNIVSRGQWQAAAWIRERKNPDRWGRRDRSQVELSGPDGGPVQVSALSVDVSAIESLASALEARARELGEGVLDGEVVSDVVVEE